MYATNSAEMIVEIRKRASMSYCAGLVTLVY